MHRALFSLDSIAKRAPGFVCSCTDGALHAAWVHVAGELDIATTPQLERTLRETQQGARLVVLDLRAVTFMDCAGVHAIVDAPGRVTDEELLAHLAERLVRYKIPQSFEYVSEPLRDDDGKVRRSALREQRIAAPGTASDTPGQT